jgi:hypothetical protein
MRTDRVNDARRSSSTGGCSGIAINFDGRSVKAMDSESRNEMNPISTWVQGFSDRVLTERGVLRQEVERAKGNSVNLKQELKKAETYYEKLGFFSSKKKKRVRLT